MDFRLILLLLTIFITGFLAIFVYFRSPNDVVAKNYMLLIVSFVTWAIIRYMIHITTDLNLARLLETAAYVLGFGIAWTFFAFAAAFPFPSKVNKKVLLLCAILTGLAFISVVKGDLVQGAVYAAYSKSFVIGFASLTLYNVVFCLLFAYAYLLLFKKYQSATSDSRQTLGLVIASTSVAVIGGLVFNLIGPYFDFFAYQILGPVCTLPFTLVVAYIIFLRGKVQYGL